MLGSLYVLFGYELSSERPCLVSHAGSVGGVGGVSDMEAVDVQCG